MYSLKFKKANCQSCYKCLRACPVKAIRFQNDQAEIVEERCISCGRCLAVCPQNAREVFSDLERIKMAIDSGKQVIASLAPSFSGYFYGKHKEFVRALYKMGFYRVEETALGADVVTKCYLDYIKNNKQDVYITTSCPSVNFLMEKYYSDLIQYMIPVVSPMIAHGKIIKNNFKDAFVVFIGPCVAKKIESHEKEYKGIIDATLTFEEIEKYFQDNGIYNDIDNPNEKWNDIDIFSRTYPFEGGIEKSVKRLDSSFNMKTLTISGVEQCMELFQSIRAGEINNTLIEISACRGSCIGGPFKNNSGYFRRLKGVEEYLKERNKNVQEVKGDYIETTQFYKQFNDNSVYRRNVMEEEINKVLRKMGKHSKEDEMNCGVCGYDTCREKAAAVLEGMAETTMCLQYMRKKAESLANVVFEHTANSVILLDGGMRVKEFSPAAERAFMIKGDMIKGNPIKILIDDIDFRKVKESGENIIGKKVNYPKYGLQFLQNIIYLPQHDMIFVTMLNINEIEKNRKELTKVKENTLNAAQEVIEKQMRVAQEIASLLGETTAETKVILTKLKKVVAGDEGEIR